MQICSMSLVMREMEIKTTMRNDLTPVRMAIINESTNKCWWWCGEKATLAHCWWECRLLQPLWKAEWSFLETLEMKLPFDPAIPLLGIFLKNSETPVQENIWTAMFISALLKTVKTWKLSQSRSVDEWMKKLWCIYPMEYYAAVKKKETIPFATTWVDLEIIIIRWNKSVWKRQIPYDLTYMWNVM